MINQQLLDFIKKEKINNKIKEQIESELTTGGWNKEDIEEGFKSIVQIPQITNSSPTSINKVDHKIALGLKMGIFVIILVLFIIFISYYPSESFLSIPIIGTPLSQISYFFNMLRQISPFVVNIIYLFFGFYGLVLLFSGIKKMKHDIIVPADETMITSKRTRFFLVSSSMTGIQILLIFLGFVFAIIIFGFLGTSVPVWGKFIPSGLMLIGVVLPFLYLPKVKRETGSIKALFLNMIISIIFVAIMVVSAFLVY